MYYIYIIKCSGNRLYTGITTDLSRRMSEHFNQSSKCAKFTRSHKAESLEACWSANNRSLASKLEYKIKSLTKPQKLRLIGEISSLEEFFGDDAKFYNRESTNIEI